MAELRSEYEQLLYFSVPKLLHLYQNLTVQDPSPESIMHDVGFLFENSPSVQAQLKQTVQVHCSSVNYSTCMPCVVS